MRTHETQTLRRAERAGILRHAERAGDSTFASRPALAGWAAGALAAGAMIALAGPTQAQDLDEVTFGTNWLAQGEHGGYYYAVANGLYEEHGLDVTIRMGGPQVNHAQLLAAGRIDFNMGTNLFQAYNYVDNDIPVTTVGAIFQKDPQVLIAHPGEYDGLADMAEQDAPTLISGDSRNTFWLWLQADYGFEDSQMEPYTFNLGPFLSDDEVVQQGYISSEPYAIEQEAGFEPDVFLLADYGWNTYSNTIEVKTEMIEDNPDLVQRFVNATIKGWYGYLNDGMDSETVQAANALIMEDNPDMTEGKIANSIALMKEYGLVVSGAAEEMGIGAMTDERWESFFEFAVESGVYDGDLDWQAAYTLEFVNEGVGM